jgi:hypothetical protein
MANANVKWLKSQKGTEKLTVDDYLFQSNGKGKAPGVRYWTCATPGCKVNAKTEGTDLVEINHVQRVSAKHGVKDDFAFLWEHAIFRHPPNKNPLTDRSEILHN